MESLPKLEEARAAFERTAEDYAIWRGIDLAQARRELAQCMDPRPALSVVWQPCSRCWGQRSELIQHDGDMFRRPCPRCIGVGEEMRF